MPERLETLKATAAGLPITGEEIAARTKIENHSRRRLNARDLDEPAVLGLLIRDRLREAVCGTYSVALTDKDLDAFALHTQQNSRDPELIQEIQGLFSDETEYRLHYLRPRALDLKLRQFFLNRRSLHTREIGEIENAMSLIREGAGLKEAAVTASLIYSETEPESLESASPIFSVLKELAPGRVHPHILETEFEYTIVRNRGVGTIGSPLELLTRRRRTFQDWLETDGRGLGLEIPGEESSREIKTRYGSTWWYRALLAENESLPVFLHLMSEFRTGPELRAVDLLGEAYMDCRHVIMYTQNKFTDLELESVYRAVGFKILHTDKLNLDQLKAQTPAITFIHDPEVPLMDAETSRTAGFIISINDFEKKHPGMRLLTKRPGDNFGMCLTLPDRIVNYIEQKPPSLPDTPNLLRNILQTYTHEVGI